MADILGMMSYIDQRSQQGMQQGKENRLADLYKQALSTPRDQRQGLIAEMAGVSPQAAFDANKHFESMEDNGRERLGQYAAAFDTLPEEMKAQAYPQLARQAQELGIPAPAEWNPSFAPHIQKLAQTLGGGGAGGNVQSTYIDRQGNRVAIMRDGSQQVLGQSENRFQMRDQPGLPLGAFDPRTGTIRAVGEAPQGQPQQMPQPGQINYSTSDGQPIPQEEVGAFQAAMRADAQGRDFSIPVGGQPAMAATGAAASRPAVAPAEMARLQLSMRADERASQAADFARQSNERAARAEQRAIAAQAVGGKPPSEGERNASGFYDRMSAAQQELDALSSGGYDPTNVRDFYTAGQGPLVNWAASDEGQQYRQKQEDWVRAKLRKESGAAIGDGEMEREIRTYFPQPGDRKDVIAAKERSRAVATQAMLKSAGRAAQLQPAQQPAAPPADARRQALLDKY